jgi:hypothetical protein
VEDYRDLPEDIKVDEDEYTSHLPRVLVEFSLRDWTLDDAGPLNSQERCNNAFVDC